MNDRIQRWQAEQKEHDTQDMATRIYEMAMSKYIAEYHTSEHALTLLDAAWAAARVFYADERSRKI